MSKRDLFVAGCLGVGLFFLSTSLAAHVPPFALGNYDVWFGADLPRVVGDMTSPSSAHGRSHVHPLFSLLAVPLTKGLVGLGYAGGAAATLLVGGAAGLTGACLFLACRALGLALIDAVLPVLVLASSGGFIFSWSVPETYPFGGATIAVALLVAACGSKGLLPWIVASAGTLAVTTTNWVSGILLSFACRRFLDFLKITAAAFLLVALAALAQKWWMPETAIFFLPDAVSSEGTFIKAPTVERALNFLLFTGVAAMPELSSPQPHIKLISSGSALTLLEPLRAVAVLAWVTLVGLGVAGAFRAPRRQLGIAVLGMLTFEFLLHQVYGDEPFLYSAHFIPAFTVLVALGFLGRGRPAARIAAAVFAVAGTVANVQSFLAACALLNY